MRLNVTYLISTHYKVFTWYHESAQCNISNIHALYGVHNKISQESEECHFQFCHTMGSAGLARTLKSLCITGHLSKAVSLLCQSPVCPGAGTYALLLQECVNRRDARLGKRIHARMVATGFRCSAYITTKLLIFYAKIGDLGCAQKLFDGMPQRSVVAWNAMISGCARGGSAESQERAVELFAAMRAEGLAPDQFTFASVLCACARLAALGHGRRVHGVVAARQLLALRGREEKGVRGEMVRMQIRHVRQGRRVHGVGERLRRTRGAASLEARVRGGLAIGVEMRVGVERSRCFAAVGAAADSSDGVGVAAGHGTHVCRFEERGLLLCERGRAARGAPEREAEKTCASAPQRLPY